MLRIVAIACVALLSAACLQAQETSAPADPSKGADWPHWRGLNYDNTSPETGLLREWPAGGPKVVWRVPILQGWSCPSVSGDDVFVTMTRFDTESHRQAQEEIMVCLDAATGRERWRTSYPISYSYGSLGWGMGGVRATPAVTDKHVYGIDPLGNVKCLDRATGKEVWGKSLGAEFYYGKHMDHKGYNNSPIIGNGVLVLHGASGAKGKGNHYNWAAGWDALTGKQLWLHEEEGPNAKIRYPDGGASAVLITLNKELCDLASYNGYLHAYRVSDGKEVLKFNLFPDGALMTGGCDLLVAVNRVVVIPFGTFLACAEIDLTDPALPTKLAWSSQEFYGNGGYHNFVHYDGYLYGVNGYNTDGNNVKGGVLTLECFDLKNGKRVWSQGGIVHGYSYIIADGLMFLRTFQTLSLVELNPEKFVLKSKVEKIHSVDTIAITDPRGLADCVMPVLSRGKLYVRTPTELICYDVKDPKAK